MKLIFTNSYWKTTKKILKKYKKDIIRHMSYEIERKFDYKLSSKKCDEIASGLVYQDAVLIDCCNDCDEPDEFYGYIEDISKYVRDVKAYSVIVLQSNEYMLNDEEINLIDSFNHHCISKFTYDGSYIDCHDIIKNKIDWLNTKSSTTLIIHIGYMEVESIFTLISHALYQCKSSITLPKECHILNMNDDFMYKFVKSSRSTDF